MIPLASDLLIRFRSQMRREGLLASASSPTGFCHSVALGVSTLTFIDVQRSWRPQCKESLAVANKPQSRSAVVPRIAMSAYTGFAVGQDAGGECAATRPYMAVEPLSALIWCKIRVGSGCKGRTG